MSVFSALRPGFLPRLPLSRRCDPSCKHSNVRHSLDRKDGTLPLHAGAKATIRHKDTDLKFWDSFYGHGQYIYLSHLTEETKNTLLQRHLYMSQVDKEKLQV